jgi:hypothetical protein
MSLESGYTTRAQHKLLVLFKIDAMTPVVRICITGALYSEKPIISRL